MDRCGQYGYSEITSADESDDSLWSGSSYLGNKSWANHIEYANPKKEFKQPKRRKKFQRSRSTSLFSIKSQTLLPCTRLPLYRAGVMWSLGKRQTPLFIFSPLCIMRKSEYAEHLGKLFNMSFKFVGTECKLLREILVSHGFRECSSQSLDYNILWSSNHLKPYQLRILSEINKVNHFPRSYEITRKDRLAKNIQRMQKLFGIQHFDFVPSSYILPDEFHEFCSGYLQDKAPYIVKPMASSRGRGIYIVSHPEEIPYDEPVIVSRYISNPLLLDGFKFDVRLYVAVTSYEPLIVYIYEEGLVRFATIRYQPGVKYLNSQCMHLTNYSVNKMNYEFVQNDDANVEDFGNKWSLGALLRYLHAEGIDVTGLMVRIEDIIIKTFLCVLPPIAGACQIFPLCKERCFELYGFDIIIDDNLRPWLLEVNLTPSLACDSPLDFKVKSHVLTDLFNLVGITCQGSGLKPQHTNFINSDQTPSTYFTTAEAQVSMSSGLESCHNAFPQSKSLDVSLAAGDHVLTGTAVDDLLPNPLTDSELKLVRRIQEEALRSGGWIRLYPDPDAWEQYVFVWPQESCVQITNQNKDNSTSGHPTFDDNREESRLFRSNKSLVASAFRSATATLLLQSINTSVLMTNSLQNYNDAGYQKWSFSRWYKNDGAESTSSSSSSSAYFHPNTAPPLVDFRPLLQTPNETLRGERLSGMKRDSKTFTSNKSTQIRLPLHSMTPEQMKSCLISVFGSSVRSTFSLEQCQYVAAFYAHTLGHMPFFMRKLGDEPYPLPGLCLLPNCSHTGDQRFVGCGIHTKLNRLSKQVKHAKNRETESSNHSSPDSYVDQTVKIQNKQTVKKRRDVRPQSLRALSLTDVQVRHAFTVYLSLVQTRLIAESNNYGFHQRLSVKGIEAVNEKIELLFRFLVRASSNLSDETMGTVNGKELRDHIRSESHPTKRTICDAKLPLTERKFALAQLLAKFIEVYEYETSIIYCQESITTDPKARSFLSYLENATEVELEELLSDYTYVQKNVDVFLGPIRTRVRRKISKNRTQRTIKTPGRSNSSTLGSVSFSSDSGIASSMESHLVTKPNQVTIPDNDENKSNKVNSPLQCRFVTHLKNSVSPQYPHQYTSPKRDTDKLAFPNPVKSALNFLKCGKQSSLASSVKNLVNKLTNHDIVPDAGMANLDKLHSIEKSSQGTQVSNDDCSQSARLSSNRQSLRCLERSKINSQTYPSRRSRSKPQKLVYSTRLPSRPTCKHASISCDHHNCLTRIRRSGSRTSLNSCYVPNPSSTSRCRCERYRVSRNFHNNCNCSSTGRHNAQPKPCAKTNTNFGSLSQIDFDFGFVEPETHVPSQPDDLSI